MSRWNRLGNCSNDKYETRTGKLYFNTWLWLRQAIDDVFISDHIEDVELFIRDGDQLIQCMELELFDNHHNDGSVTREVIVRLNKKSKKVKYIG